MENFLISEKRGIIFGSKSPFPFAEVLALRMSEFREKSTLVIESFFHKPEITKNQLPIRDECLLGYILYLCCPRPKGGRAFPVVCAIPGRRSHGREASFHTRLHQN